ncbi:GMC oxidoreductase [Trametes coccinea BRFM310]|uniref:GMC oxidoreductase n=1 Tax=Trametes coccinea (strain BRFM310) TaxID=1353009 RepID=A0A1Y2IIX9_TRAC3|nr:GMC oxidoreductase [Trametes coccinea BRFM310]
MPLPDPRAAQTIAAASAALSAFVIVMRYLYGKNARAYSAIVTDPAKVAKRIVNKEDEYDFNEYDVVILGGGTAGCVIASRLSEDPSVRVLLLEAGQSSIKNPFAIIPLSYSLMFHSKHEWDLYTIPQQNAGSAQKYWPRAKLLGGCSCLNAMIFHAGAPEDYDEWCRLQKGQEGALQWSYQQFLPYMHKFEKYHPSPEFPDVDPDLRGKSGPVDIGYFGWVAPGTRKFIEACDKVGIPAVPDVNTAKGTLGATKVTYITPKGRRVTSEYAYLTPEVLSRPNLKVVTGAHVTRILFDTSGPTPRAVGAEFTQQNGEKFRVKARKEVVLSAGAVHTPQILMLSGVGPAEHLKSLEIPVVADLPGVGSNLMDHVVVDLNYRDKTGNSLAFVKGRTLKHQIKLARAIWEYKFKKTGPLTSNVAEGIAFVRSDDPKLFPTSEFPPETVPEDTTSGPGAPDIELFFSPVGYKMHTGDNMPPGDFFGLHGVLLRPTSKGTIRLKSKDPNDPPIIDPQYLTTEHDVQVLVRATRLLARIVSTEPLASMLDPAGDADAELDHALHKLDDAAVADLVRRRVETLYHPACTARMAPKEDGGVVDPFLRVHGIPNLRVADASVFPTIVSGHTAAPSYAIGEKAADLIKASLSSSYP